MPFCNLPRLLVVVSEASTNEITVSKMISLKVLDNVEIHRYQVLCV
jgi:hypothetical protein